MDSAPDREFSNSLGSPIRKSPDHSLLAAPRGLSQLATSFFACLRLGILTHALSSLTIKLTLDTESFALSKQHLRFVARQYSVFKDPTAKSLFWWAWVELNYRPHPYQGCALAT